MAIKLTSIYIICDLYMKKYAICLVPLCPVITIHVSNKHFCYKLVYMSLQCEHHIIIHNIKLRKESIYIYRGIRSR